MNTYLKNIQVLGGENMSYHVKKDRLIKALKDVGLYQIFNISDENDFVLFQTEQSIKKC